MSRRVAILLIAVLASCKSGDSRPSATPTGDNGLDLRRVMVIGASMSAGFGGTRVDQLMTETIKAKHVMRASTSIFFSQSALLTGKRQLDDARAFKPTLVIALDFLFWYAYVNASHAQRTQRVADALASLQNVPGRIILGDIADMRGANHQMLPPRMVPPRDQLAGFNKQIHAWAKGRTNVHIIPFSAWSAPLQSGGSVVVKAGTPAIPATTLLAPDRLHPNAAGMRYIVRRLVENLLNAFPDTAKNALRSN